MCRCERDRDGERLRGKDERVVGGWGETVRCGWINRPGLLRCRSRGTGMATHNSSAVVTSDQGARDWFKSSREWSVCGRQTKLSPTQLPLNEWRLLRRPRIAAETRRREKFIAASNKDAESHSLRQCDHLLARTDSPKCRKSCPSLTLISHCTMVVLVFWKSFRALWFAGRR